MATPAPSFRAQGVASVPPAMTTYLGVVKVSVMELVAGQSQIEIEWPPGAREAGPNLQNAQTQFIQLVIAELTAILPTLPG